MTILYIAEITGKPGLWLTRKLVPRLRKEYTPDFVIANVNAVTGLGGIGKQHALLLKNYGIDCMTAGGNIFQQQEMIDACDHLRFLVKPCNIPSNSYSKKAFLYRSDSYTIAVISLLGRLGQHRILADNPFNAIDRELQSLEKADIIIVDYAALATAEKQSMGFYLDGRVNAVIGSGTKVATADLMLLPEGTAYITDAGRTGSFDSVAGWQAGEKIEEYKTGLFQLPVTSWERPMLQGLLITIDEGTGIVTRLERITKEKQSPEKIA